MNKLKHFIQGIASIFNIWGSQDIKIQGDEDAIRSDWEAVGNDFSLAEDTKWHALKYHNQRMHENPDIEWINEFKVIN